MPEDRAALRELLAKPRGQMTVNELYEVAGYIPALLNVAAERDRLLVLLRRAWFPLDIDAEPDLWREIETMLDGEGETLV